MSHRKMPVTKQIRLERRAEAEERNAAHNELTVQEKIDCLPEGGAKKERARLTALLAAALK